MLRALAHLTEDRVEEGFLVIMEESPSVPGMDDFNDYFVRQWMENTEIGFLWLCSGVRHRTTNIIETYHHTVNSNFPRKPNWYL